MTKLTTVEYERDEDGRVVCEYRREDDGQTVQRVTTQYEYDENGQVARETRTETQSRALDDEARINRLAERLGREVARAFNDVEIRIDGKQIARVVGSRPRGPEA